MNKKWKRFWIVSGAIAGVGLIFLILGVTMGGTWNEVRMRFPSGIGIHPRREQTETEHFTVPEAVGEKIEFSGVHNLEVDVNGMEVYIRASTSLVPWVDIVGADEHAKLQVYQDGDTLKVKTKGNLHHINHKGSVCIYIPSGIRLDHVEVSVGAGVLDMNMENVECAQTDISIGAGEAEISDLLAERLEIDCGAGNVKAEKIQSSDFDIKCGMGVIDLGIMEGKKEDYNYDIECGLGTVKLDGDSYSGLVSEKKTYNEISQNMNIDCGMGKVNVRFQ